MSLHEKKTEIFPDAKKRESKFEDERYSGMLVSKARQSQRRDLVLGQMVKQAKAKKRMGFELTPEEEWVMHNKELFL